MKISRDLLVDLYYRMVRIRRVQLRIESEYHLDEMKTPVHLCIGQEAVAVGVCAQLNKKDYISSNHRGHGHYLAKGGDLKGLIAELYCRETGCSKGRGGSMHLVDVAVGHMGSSSIVGGGIPIATGLGLSIKMNRSGQVSAVFFSDGAADEGVFYESINFAVLKCLPVLFVYENNQYSVCSHISKRQRGKNIFHAIGGELMLTDWVDGNDVLEVYRAAGEAVTSIRDGRGPAFIECHTYRMRGHAGAGPDLHLGYRDEEEILHWERQCPVDLLKKKIITGGYADAQDLLDIEKAIDHEIDEAFQYARNSPLPKKQDIGRYLFRE